MATIPALLLVLLAAKPGGAPLAEVWPYQAKRLPGGGIEYAYDLAGVKAAGATPDAKAAWGDEKVSDFLKSLPRESRVTLKAGAALILGAGRGSEPVALVSALSAISAGPLASNDPLARSPGARLRPPLHPLEPKLLLSAQAALWRTRRVMEGAHAAILLDTERLHAAFWNKLADKALARVGTTSGDAKEGAVALAARLYASGACLDSARVPAAAKAKLDVAKAIEAELVAARFDPDTPVAEGIYGWSRELACTRVRTRILAQPFPQSRAGAAAALTLLGLLTADPKLEASWVALRLRRDTLAIGPSKEGLLDYRERTGGKVEDELENMAAFIEALGATLPPVPPPLQSATTVFAQFYSQLEGAGRVSAVDELLAAAQDDRLTFATGESAPAIPRMEAALAQLVSDKAKGVELDAAWRAVRASGFAALIGGAHDHRGEGNDLAEAPDERTELKIRLMVPPTVELEPAPAAYLAAAEALEQLNAAATKLGVANLQAVLPEGGRSGESIASELQRLALGLRGLARLSTDPDAAGAQKEVAEGRRLLAGWRTDPVFARDVREARAFPINQGAERLHAAIVGVARRELLVSFQSPPSTQLAAPGPFEVVGGEQRYLVPVLASTSALGKSTAAPIDRTALRALCEGARRTPNEIEAAFVEAMRRR